MQNNDEGLTKKLNKKDKLPTMADIAKKVGVSRQLVSLVMSDSPGPSEETKKSVLKAAKELNYHPNMAARMLRSNHTGIIGVLFTLDQTFHSDLIEALYPIAKEQGYNLILSAMTNTRDEMKAVHELLSYRCEALILIGTKMNYKQWQKLNKILPIVIVGQNVEGRNVDYVVGDDKCGMQIAIDYLVNLGHRSILHIDGGMSPGAEIRRNTYFEYMCHFKLRSQMRVIPGDATEESGVKAAYKIVEGIYRPTAVIASNDRCAIGLLQILRQSNVNVPEDISVIGYDDIGRAGLPHINLTTIHQDTREMAQETLKLISEKLIEKRTEIKGIVLPPRLVIRGTASEI